MAGHFIPALKLNGPNGPNGYSSHQDEWPPAPAHFSVEDPTVGGFHRPTRFEGDIGNLEVFGEIPKDINGTFYRVMPEPQFPSFTGNDVWFNGDGNISAFRIANGHVDFKQRYVRTEKFVREAKARRSLLGKYRNKYTDLVDFKVRSTANTNIVFWNGKLLALKEDSPPYAMDPDTLETIGLHDFDGQLPCLTFTAHPKFDPVTREMVCFGYEAKGDASNDICYYTFDQDGKLGELVWLVSPVCGMIHDFAVTENFVLFPIICLTCDLDRLKNGGEHWQWDYSIPTYIGVLPRRQAKGDDVKWFRAPPGFAGHTANAFEENGKIYFHMTFALDNAFWWWPDKDGKAPKPGEAETHLCQFEIDYKSDNLELGLPEYFINGEETEFPRIDDRLAMARHSRIFVCVMDKTAGTDFPFILPRMGAGYPLFNSLASFDVGTKEYKKYFAGPRKFCQECVFVPRGPDALEGDGYLIALLNNYDEMCSEMVILDTRTMAEIALIKLPVRLRAGLHGNWVDSSDVDGHPQAIPTAT